MRSSCRQSVYTKFSTGPAGNILAYIGVALEMSALVCLSRPNFRWTAVFVALPAAGAVLFLIVDVLPATYVDHGQYYVMVSSVVVGALYGTGGTRLVWNNAASEVQRILGYIFAALALCFWGRAYASFEVGFGVFTPNFIQSMTFITWLVTTIVSVLGFMLVLNENANRSLRLAAISDPLTTLANRRRFNDVLNTEFSRLGRSGAPLSLILLDVDYFKAFNDRYGHVSGDKCLKQIGDAMNRAVGRASDLVARFGGEEFTVVAPETDGVGARSLAESIRRSVENLAIPHVLNTASPFVTVSLGVVTCYAFELSSPEHIVQLADKALYQAKQSGRNRLVVLHDIERERINQEGLVRLIWKDMADSGDDDLDKEHKALYSLANQCLTAIVENWGRERCKNLLDEIIDTIGSHFKNEELLVSKSLFPELARHIECHKSLIAQALDMSERFDRNELSFAEVFHFLAYEVVAKHLLHEDRKFFPYLMTESQRS